MSVSRNRPAGLPCIIQRRATFLSNARRTFLTAKRTSSLCFVDDVWRTGIQYTALLPDPAICSPHVGPVKSIDIDNSSDCRFLLAGGHDATISLYDTEERHSCLSSNAEGHSTFGNHLISPIARSIRGRRQVHANINEEENGEGTWLPNGHVGSLTSVRWYLDNGIFVSASTDGTVIIWNTNEFTPAFCFALGTKESHSSRYRYKAAARSRTNAVDCLSLPTVRGGCSAESGDGMPRSDTHNLIAAGCGNTIYMCDVNSGSASHHLIGHTDNVLAVEWSPTQKYYLVSASRDRTIRLWDIRKSGALSCLHVFNSEGLRTGNPSNHVHGSTASKLRSGPHTYANVQNASSHIESHGSAITNVAYSPDGSYLTAVGADGQLALWDLRRLNCTSPSFLWSLSTNSSASKGQEAHHSPSYVPTYFSGTGGVGTGPGNHRQKTALAVSQPGSSRSAMVWCGNDRGQLLGFKLREVSGPPDIVLCGHLDGVDCVAINEKTWDLFTGSKDGMIMAWGSRPVGASKRNLRENVNLHNNNNVADLLDSDSIWDED